MKKIMTKKCNHKIKVILLLTFTLFSIFCFNPFLSPSSTNLEGKEYNNIKTSAGEITILTPESINYNESSIDGYYLATYGFDNEEYVTTGANIDFIDEFYGSYNYDNWIDLGIFWDSYKGHAKILRVRDCQSGMQTYGVHNIDAPQATGTIEFFENIPGYTDDTYSSRHRCFIKFQGTDGTDAFQIMMDNENGDMSYYDGSTWQVLNNSQAGEWYHNSLSFDCTTGTNGQFTWVFSAENGTEIDRIENIEFQNDVATIGKIYIGTEVSDWGGGGYFDAFGFSWDPNYDVGDNLNKGLFLSFENTTTLDWMGYSLDGAENVTIFGNTTIPMPADGPHFVQLFGNTSTGTYYASDITLFTVNCEFLPIISPENSTLIESMDGYIPEFYGFGNEEDRLLISFENSSMFDWMGYSLDGAAIVTIYGNTTIPLPPDGFHFVQVFGNTSTGTYYASDIRYFTVSTETSNSPLDIIIFFIIFIIILSVIGVAIPTSYIIVSRKKKEENPHEKVKSRFKQTNKYPLYAETIDSNKIQSGPQKDIRDLISLIPPIVSKSKKIPPKQQDHKEIPNDLKKQEILRNKSEKPKNETNENELEIFENDMFCQVHRGAIHGVIYVCPKCKTKYCLECATLLAEKNEPCWACGEHFKINKPNKFNATRREENTSLLLFHDDNGLEPLMKSGDINITALSKDFLDAINEFSWDEEDREEFVNEMLGLPPSKRMEYIEEMRKNQPRGGQGI